MRYELKEYIHIVESNAKDIFLYVLVYQIYHSYIFGVWYFFELENQINALCIESIHLTSFSYSNRASSYTNT